MVVTKSALMQSAVGGRKISPNGVCIQISRIYEYVTAHDKRDFANVIKIKDLEMRRLSWISRGPNLIIHILRSREPFPAVGRKGDVRIVVRQMQYCWI